MKGNHKSCEKHPHLSMVWSSVDVYVYKNYFSCFSGQYCSCVCCIHDHLWLDTALFTLGMVAHYVISTFHWDFTSHVIMTSLFTEQAFEWWNITMWTRIWMMLVDNVWQADQMCEDQKTPLMSWPTGSDIFLNWGGGGNDPPIERRRPLPPDSVNLFCFLMFLMYICTLPIFTPPPPQTFVDIKFLEINLPTGGSGR